MTSEEAREPAAHLFVGSRRLASLVSLAASLCVTSCAAPQGPARSTAITTPQAPIPLSTGKVDTLSAEPGEDHEAPHYPSLSLSRAREKVALDGMLGEWPPLVTAKHRSTEQAKEVSVNLLYDTESLYIAAEIHDTVLSRTETFSDREDRLTLRVSFLSAKPGAAEIRVPFDLSFYAGKPGESEGMVKHRNRQVPGSKIVEVAFDGGYRFEASVPWSYLTKGGEPRAGIFASATYHDAETHSTTSTVSPPGSGDAWTPTEPELAAWERLSPETRSSARPEGTLVGDFSETPDLEVAEIVARELWIVGHAFLGGTRYFSRTVSARTTLSTHKFTFLTKPTIVIEEARETRGSNVTSLTLLDASGPAPRVLLQHAIQFGQCTNAIRLEADKVTVSGPSSRCDGPSDLRWISTARIQVPYRWTGTELVADPLPDSRPTLKRTPAERATRPVGEAPRESPTKVDLVARVLAAKNLPAGTKADFRVSGNVAEGPQPETVLVVDGEIVVVGEHFRGGAGFLSIRPGSIGKSRILDVAIKRFDGVPGALIAVIFVHTLDDLTPPVALESLALYAVRGDRIERVLWLETRRTQGEREHGVTVSLLKQGVTTTSNTARGWTKETYAPGELATDLIAMPPPGNPGKRTTFVLENGRFRKP
jgi:hypothetical protein